MDHDALKKEKPRVLDINTAWIAARRVVFGVPLSQRQRDIELIELFTTKDDPPPIISSNSLGEDLQAKEGGSSSEERNPGSVDQGLTNLNMPTTSEQQSAAGSPRESLQSANVEEKKGAHSEGRQHYIILITVI